MSGFALQDRTVSPPWQQSPPRRPLRFGSFQILVSLNSILTLLHAPCCRHSSMLRVHSSVAVSESFSRCQNVGTFALHGFAGTITFVIVQKCDFTLPLVLIMKKNTKFTCWTPQCGDQTLRATARNLPTNYCETCGMPLMNFTMVRVVARAGVSPE